jgi:hypothetical protein
MEGVTLKVVSGVESGSHSYFSIGADAVDCHGGASVDSPPIPQGDSICLGVSLVAFSAFQSVLSSQ